MRFGLMAPIYKEWDAFSEVVEDHKIEMDFRLVYQGVLNSTGNKSASGKVHDIRRYFHKQLVNLWKTNSFLNLIRIHNDIGEFKSIETGDGILTRTTINMSTLIEKYSLGTKRYLPLICPDFGLTCSLDILLLRRDLSAVITSGDIDGRIKTLIDAMRIPKVGEAANEGDENPLYCLMADDNLISEVKVTGDHLYAEPEQIVENPKTTPSGDYKIKTNHVLAVINVKARGHNLWL